MGGGVIPIAIDPEGHIHVLLGRERYMPQWRGSCRWSGFEGSRKEGECLMETAVREFVEESLGIVMSTDRIQGLLQTEGYLTRIVLKIHNDRRSERYHSTYLVLIDWDPSLPQRFKDLRMTLEQVDRTVQEWKHRRPPVLGDTIIGPVKEKADHGVEVLANPSSTCIVSPPWLASEHPSKFLSVCLHGSQAHDVMEWSHQRARVERALVAHPCVTVQRDDTWNHVQDVCVLKDHLEKDQIRWWTLDELDRVLQQHGQLGTDRFRPYFLPVLQVMLHELRSAPLPGVAPPCEPCDVTESEVPTPVPEPRPALVAPPVFVPSPSTEPDAEWLRSAP